MGGVGGRRGPEPLLPAPLARLLGLGLLATLGAVQWRRMVEGAGPGRTLAFVALAVGGTALALALRERGRRAAVAALLVAAPLAVPAVAGVPRALWAPARWDELAAGVARGLETLATVTLPYRGADAGPVLALELGGAALCLAAGLLAAWPRREGAGFPFLALAALLVLVVTPVVALGAADSVPLGLAIAALAVTFLFLERLPLRPGAGVALLGGLAVAGALPLGVAADRDAPWWDYRGFAAGLGPASPVRFDWEHGYGPLNWPRDGREILRVRARDAHYWKAASLEEFDGQRWVQRGTPDPEGFSPSADLAPGWTTRRGWTGEARVTVRALRGETFVAAGTALGVEDSPTPAVPGLTPGVFAATRELRPGDAYAVRFHDPRPDPGRLATATSGEGGAQADALLLTVPIDARLQRRLAPPAPRPARLRLGPRPRGLSARARPTTAADVAFPPFASPAPPVAGYTRLGRPGSGPEALRHSPYRRAWALARRLKRGATPYAFARRIDAHLERGFRYTETPPPPRPGQPPLDAFLFDARAGYCQHFAGAMALLLRMGGVPARVASGFSPGGRRGGGEEWIVRDRDAHAWVEAWFDDIGWVTFDPTPPGTFARRRFAALGATDGPGAGGDAAATPTPTPEARRAAGLARDLDATPGAGGGGAAAREAAEAGGGWPPLLPVAALAAALVLLLAALEVRRRAATAGVEDRAVAELVTALRRTGRRVPPGTTLGQLEARLGGSAYVRALQAARYAGRAGAPSAADRRALRRDLAAGLGVAGRLRALWALPPRRR